MRLACLALLLILTGEISVAKSSPVEDNYGDDGLFKESFFTWGPSTYPPTEPSTTPGSKFTHFDCQWAFSSGQSPQ